MRHMTRKTTTPDDIDIDIDIDIKLPPRPDPEFPEGGDRHCCWPDMWVAEQMDAFARAAVEAGRARRVTEDMRAAVP